MQDFVGITVNSESYVSRNHAYVGMKVDVWKWDSIKFERRRLGYFKVYKTSYERRKQTKTTLLETFDSLRIKRLLNVTDLENSKDESVYKWEQTIDKVTVRTPGYLDIWAIHARETNFEKNATDEDIQEAFALFITDYVNTEDIIFGYGWDVCKLDNVLEPLGFEKCECGILIRDMRYSIKYQLKGELEG